MSEDLPISGQQFIRIEEADNWHIRRKYSSQTRFTSISPIRVAGSRDQTPDLLDLLGEISKGARDLFLTIKRNMDYRNHLAHLPNSGLTQSQISQRSRAIRELEKAGKGLACRVPTSGISNLIDVEQRIKPGTFMISPEYIFPGKKYKEEINHMWTQCRMRRS